MYYLIILSQTCIKDPGKIKQNDRNNILNISSI